MQKFPEKGFAHIFTILILLAGIVAGLYLIKHPQILRSKAANDQTRIEFVNGKGEIITATNTPNVRIKLTYVFPSITPSPTPTPIPTSTQLGFPNDFKDITQSTGYRYDAKDNQGVCLHTMKIINNPRGGYLGVYHCSKNDIFSVYLGTSTNVLNWQQVVVIDEIVWITC